MIKKRVGIDLLIINVLTVAFLIIVITDGLLWLRAFLGFPVIILFPGYLFIGILYPRKDSLSHINRLALSFGLSIILMVLLGLLLNYSPWGIGLHCLNLSVFIVILSLSAVTWYVRGRYHADDRYGIGIKLSGWSLKHYFGSLSRAQLSLVILLACSVTGFAVFLGCTLAGPPQKQAFAEFSILGMENRASDYPLELRPGEGGVIMAEIVNHEHEAANYRVEVIVEGNKSYELSPITLEPGEKWHGELEFTPEPVVKKQKIIFQLSKDTGQPEAVRYLWVNVKA